MLIFGLILSILISSAGSSNTDPAPSVAQGQNSSFMTQVRSLVDSDRKGDALRLLLEKINSGSASNEKGQLLFMAGVIAYELTFYDQSIEVLDQYISVHGDLEDHAHYYRGMSHLRKKNFEEAKKSFEKVLQLNFGGETEIESKIELIHIAIDMKKWSEATRLIKSIERKLRSHIRYPEVIYQILRVELLSGRKDNLCRWARRLYVKFPAYEGVETWGVDLQKNEVDGKKVQCVASPEDQKDRLRNLQYAGQSERARKEIDVLMQRSSDLVKFHTDSILANYLIEEGQVTEALKILSSHYEEQKNSYKFLMAVAKAAVRAGEFQVAVSSYDRAHDLSPGSKNGKNALFLSAILSFQSQDYDGATERFEKILKRSPGSGLANDARWYLGFIKYMKGDFIGAVDGLSKIATVKPKRRRAKAPSASPERTRYWIAMSLMKMGRLEEASNFFDKLTKEKGFSYYSIAAKARLNQIDKNKKKNKDSGPQLAQGIPKNLQNLPVEIGSATSFIGGPAGDFSSRAESPVASLNSASQPEDEDESMISEDSDVPQAETTDTELSETQDSGEPGLLTGLVSSGFKDPRLNIRFQRASQLSLMGYRNLAKAELLEIERRTRNSEHFKKLMSDYESSQNYYRSSYIGEINFQRERLSAGLSGAKDLWLSTYPRAFDANVISASKTYGVPYELVWAIMRAESHYNPEVKSPVGALGLMQVMPMTAITIAKILNFASFSVKDMTQVDLNVKLGARYLAKLMKQFKQKVPLSAAAYNAGPHRVEAWLKYLGRVDMDEFIEHIPYLQTRNYVKKVVHNFVVYGALYSGAKPEVLAPSWLSEPVGVTLSGPVSPKETWEGYY